MIILFVTYCPFFKKHVFIGLVHFNLISLSIPIFVYIWTCLRISLSSLTILPLSLTPRECRALLLSLSPLSSRLLLSNLLFCAGLLNVSFAGIRFWVIVILTISIRSRSWSMYNLGTGDTDTRMNTCAKKRSPPALV